MNAPRQPEPQPRLLVVGYDGSDTSRAAVTWAARRAGPGGRLVIVHAAPQRRTSRDWARQDVRALGSELLGNTPFETELVDGPPERAIPEIARQRRADEIVVGRREHGLVRSGLGTVSRAVLEDADCPVAVVPPGFDPDYRLPL